MSKYIRLYQSGSEVNEAYLLEEGNAAFFITDTDKYSVNGKNLIIGGTELILNIELSLSASRIETSVVGEGAKLKKLSRESFSEGLKNPSFLLNLGMVLAKQVSLSNQIITKNRTALKGKEEDRQRVCLEYFRIVRDLRDENVKRKLPWLKELVSKYEMSLVFKEGEALSRTAEPVRITGGSALSDKTMEFKKDSIICEEGTDGEEMYILQSGSIDVVVKGNAVAVISDAGTPIGEIALLIGEKRTATLRAKNDVVLTRIHKNDLREIAERDISVIRSIVSSLSKKHYQNVHKAQELTSQIVQKELSDDSAARQKVSLKYTAACTELSAVRNALSEAVFKKNEPFLKEIALRYNVT